MVSLQYKSAKRQMVDVLYFHQLKAYLREPMSSHYEIMSSAV